MSTMSKIVLNVENRKTFLISLFNKNIAPPIKPIKEQKKKNK